MHVGIIANTRSGRNKASVYAQQCQGLLSERGHQWTLLDTSASKPEPAVWSCDRLIIIGGDGTVHHALPELQNRQIPFYHLATGTSNLIAKELGMPRNPITAVNWIEQGGLGVLDVPTIDTLPFLIMCCMGMDAGIIHRFEGLRTRSGGFRNYIRPVIQESLHPRTAWISVQTEDEPLSVKTPANVIISNMPTYALHLNPCPDANPRDGQLDMIAASCATTLGWMIQNLMFMLRLQPPASDRIRATSIQVTATEQPCLVQMDGEIAVTPTMPRGILEAGQTIELALGNDTVVPIKKPMTTSS
ncbi:MAG: hypothetical protein JJ974_03315 [Phycisphaerales bacterium]|nr:hypothetical protein [Phycisphaerales bacterium]